MKTEHEKEIIEKNNNRSASETKNTNMLMAAFMIFIFPIISVFLGAFVGGYVGQVIGFSIIISQIIGGIMAFVLAMVIIKLFDKSIKADNNSKKVYWDDL